VSAKQMGDRLSVDIDRPHLIWAGL
jgi:hypothetical protein